MDALTQKLKNQLHVRHDYVLRLIVFTISAHGIFIILVTLLDQLASHMNFTPDSDFDIPLLIGLGLIYLSTRLQRRKQTAWLTAVLIYTFMIGLYAHRIALALQHHDWLEVVAKLIVPLLLIGLLLTYRQSFTVRSDIRSFSYALRTSLLVLLVSFAYGTVGFLLLDKHDFHQEISPAGAMHRTVDQFGLSDSRELIPRTKRAHLFVNSLSVVSVGTVIYIALSLFQPIRARVTSEEQHRKAAEALLAEHPGKSEDFFKIWPHDKAYIFSASGQSAVAYRVERGVALVVGDPFGSSHDAKHCLQSFEDLCYGNDWLPVFVHTEPDWSKFYERQGYTLQKIGEEAVVDIAHFQTAVKDSKYFRQIRNKFNREKYSTEVLQPPHDKALISRLKTISDEWLSLPGRAERGFMLGYFSEDYLQASSIVVARDSAGTIQGFINQIPSYDPSEANFDMLRHASTALGNINDYLLMAFIDHLHAQQIARLNLGLSPLSGMENMTDKSLISRALQVLYQNGDRFYSFSGLQRFKSKYEPQWSDRYVAYKGNPANFLRAMNALTRAMRVKLK